MKGTTYATTGLSSPRKAKGQASRHTTRQSRAVNPTGRGRSSQGGGGRSGSHPISFINGKPVVPTPTPEDSQESYARWVAGNIESDESNFNLLAGLAIISAAALVIAGFVLGFLVRSLL